MQIADMPNALVQETRSRIPSGFDRRMGHYLAALAFCIQVFIFVDERSHSVSDTLYGIFPYWAPAFLLWLWIANSKSARVGR